MTRTVLILGTAIVAAAWAATAASAPSAPRLKLPYDLEASGSARYVYIADGLRHQILRYDQKKSRTTVYAGNGRTGSSGDGGPARRARLTEPTEIVLDRSGNLYFSDVNQGRVRRIDRRGTISTVARVRAAAGISIDPTGRYLAIASIEGWVYGLALPSGTLQRLAGNGTDKASGDGGPALEAGLSGPHDVTYDADGNLFIAGYGNVRRIEAATGRIDTAFELPGFKIVAVPGGTFYLLNGDPNGGTVTRVDGTGKILQRIGTGKITRHSDRTPIGRVGFLPSDVEPVPGAILISETRPVAAIRRLATGSRTLTTLLP